MAFQLHYELSKTNVCKDKQDKLYGENKYRVKEKKKKRVATHLELLQRCKKRTVHVTKPPH